MSWERVQALLSTELVEIGGSSITLMHLIMAVVVIIATILLARFFERAVVRALKLARIEDVGTLGVAGRVIYYICVVVGFTTALEVLGFSLGNLFAAGAVLAVAIGFAAQNVLQNFFSGLILLSEGAIKPGDILEVEGRVVRVTKMGIRATVVRTRDEEEVILPNALLSQAAVKNYTLGDSIFRLRTTVGVHYDSDMKQVAEVIREALAKLSFRRMDRDPLVLMSEFGDFAVIFDASIWVDDPWGTNRTKSQMNEAIWWALKDAGITIAFPQVDVHLDSPALEALRRSFGSGG